MARNALCFLGAAGGGDRREGEKSNLRLWTLQFFFLSQMIYTFHYSMILRSSGKGSVAQNKFPGTLKQRKICRQNSNRRMKKEAEGSPAWPLSTCQQELCSTDSCLRRTFFFLYKHVAASSSSVSSPVRRTSSSQFCLQGPPCPNMFQHDFCSPFWHPHPCGVLQFSRKNKR